MRTYALLYVILFTIIVRCACGDDLRQDTESLENALDRLQRATPRKVADCQVLQQTQLLAAAGDVYERAVDVSERPVDDFTEAMNTTRVLFEAKLGVDLSYENALRLRSHFAAVPAGPSRRESIRIYLQMNSRLIHLSGSFRYLLREFIDKTAYFAARNPRHRHDLIDYLLEQRSSVGAQVMSVLLVDPPAASRAKPADVRTKTKVLELIAATRNFDLLPVVTVAVRANHNSPDLTLLAAHTVRQLGLPQDPRPGQDSESSQPPITAKELRDIVLAMESGQLDSAQRRRRIELLEWLQNRLQHGIIGDEYRVGNFAVRAGDWFLMHNPSPYNLFTDLSPGLFTHVGVVAVEEGSDGIRRFVIVDLPERGDTIPAINVDQYIQRSLHYFFVRHETPDVGKKMGEVALSIVGNETEFDLTFQTDRVLQLKGQPLSGRRIHTYCAGLLVLCAQETSAELDEFFPIRESPAAGNTLANLGKLGLSIGNEFVSPTGALFSPRLKIIARRHPMYDPTREIKEVIYNHFAVSMSTQNLIPSPTAYQSLRQKLAEASQSNPLLAQLLAKANNVSEHMDLVSAARAAAVIETLDEIADGNMDQFLEARYALTAGSVKRLAAQGTNKNDMERIQEYRKRHDTLFHRWTQRQLSVQAMRSELVAYYSARGKRQLDERFFGNPE